MGTSLLTNSSSMTALQSLRMSGDMLDTTQMRVSTGLRINEAADNTAYWSISSMMRSDVKVLGAVSDAMSLGRSQIDVANATIDQSKQYLDNVQRSLTTAYEKGDGDVRKIQADIQANITNIEASIYSANLAEKNMLANGGGEVSIAGAYRREGSSVYVDMIEVGGPKLNFATNNGDGTLNLENGVLRDVLGKTGVDVIALQKTYEAAKTALAVAQTKFDEAQLNLNQAQSNYDYTAKSLNDEIKAREDKLAKDPSADVSANDKRIKDWQAQLTIRQESLDKSKSNLNAKQSELNTAQDNHDTSLEEFDSGIANMTVADFAEADLSGIDSILMKRVLKTIQQKTANGTDAVITAGAQLGAAKAQVSGQIDYVSKLLDSVDKGIGALVDADMNAESARLASLQVQQQLGIQALSIANQNSQNILSLFQQQ